MAVRTVLDRERIPGAAASRPGQRPREDTHVYVAHDLPQARVCRVVDVSDRDRRDALPERGAVVIQTGVGHPDHLPGPIEAVGPITIVRREVRLDYPVRLCIPRMDRLDRINELDGGLMASAETSDAGIRARTHRKSPVPNTPRRTGPVPRPVSAGIPAWPSHASIVSGLSPGRTTIRTFTTPLVGMPGRIFHADS